MKKTVTKRSRRRCARCRKPVPTATRGRPRVYCSRNCQQRAYERRRTEAEINTRLPMHLLTGDMQDTANRDAIRRVVIDTLREIGLLPKNVVAPLKRKPALRTVDEPEAET